MMYGTGSDADPFLMGGPRTARLITTRIQDTLPGNAVPVQVDEMERVESVDLLRKGLPADGEEGPLLALAHRLGWNAQLLAMVNRFLLERCRKRDSVDHAVVYAASVLDTEG